MHTEPHPPVTDYATPRPARVKSRTRFILIGVLIAAGLALGLIIAGIIAGWSIVC